jgi:hypothetical protein
MLSVIMLSVIIMRVIVLSVDLLSSFYVDCHYVDCGYSKRCVTILSASLRFTGNNKGGSITVLMTSCLSGLD